MPTRKIQASAGPMAKNETRKVNEAEPQQRQTTPGEKDSGRTPFPNPSRKTLGRKVMAPFKHSGPGAPTTLTPAIIAKLAAFVEEGNFLQPALALLGIPRCTYYHWLERGEADQVRGKPSLYVELLDTIKKADAACERRNVLGVQAGELGWQSKAWILERKYPTRWGHHFSLSLNQAQDFMRKVVSVLAVHVPDHAVLARIVADVRRIEGEQHRELLAARK
jgi:hypothetical protein